MVELKKGEIYKLPIKNGYLDIRVTDDGNYFELDVEYIDDNDTAEKTRPRVLIEHNKNTDVLRTLVWADAGSEDYSDEMIFDI